MKPQSNFFSGSIFVVSAKDSTPGPEPRSDQTSIRGESHPGVRSNGAVAGRRRNARGCGTPRSGGQYTAMPRMIFRTHAAWKCPSIHKKLLVEVYPDSLVGAAFSCVQTLIGMIEQKVERRAAQCRALY